VFEKFFHNFYFLGILLAELAIQVILNLYLPGLTKQVQLSKQEWGSIVAVGATVIVIAFLLKLTPETWIDRIPTQKMVDEDKQIKNSLLAMYQGETKKDDESTDQQENGEGEEEFVKVQ